MWCTGLVAPRHVASSQTRAQTHVSCLGRRILNHCAREVPRLRILKVWKNLLQGSNITTGYSGSPQMVHPISLEMSFFVFLAGGGRRGYLEADPSAEGGGWRGNQSVHFQLFQCSASLSHSIVISVSEFLALLELCWADCLHPYPQPSLCVF